METEDLKALEERTTYLYEWVESNDTIDIVDKLLELDILKKENDMLRKDIQSFINDLKKLNKDKN